MRKRYTTSRADMSSLKGDMGMIGFGSIGNKVSVEDATEVRSVAFCRLQSSNLRDLVDREDWHGQA